MGRLCIALDSKGEKENLRFLEEVKKKYPNEDIYAKVGAINFIRYGAPFVKEVKSLGYPVFLDLKLHDISNTMKESFLAVNELGIDLLSVHLTNHYFLPDLDDNVKIYDFVYSNEINFKLIGITVLTDFDNDDFYKSFKIHRDDFITKTIKIDLLSGVVLPINYSNIFKFIKNYSPKIEELSYMKTYISGNAEFNLNFYKLVILPGVSFFNEKSNNYYLKYFDIIMNPYTMFVVGRDIYNNENPLAAVNRILKILNFNKYLES